MLAAMADLEEKRSGEFLFDRAYLTTTFGSLSGGVRRMVESLQSLADGRYPGLVDAHAAIDEKIAAALRGPRIDLAGPSVLRLAQITGETAHLAGGKMSHLGRLAADLALPVPEGFVVTAAAFARFMAHAGIMERVRERLATVRIDALEQIEQASAEIRALIAASELPSELGQAIRHAVAELAAGAAASRVRGPQQRGLGGRRVQLRRPVFELPERPRAPRSSGATRTSWGASSPRGRSSTTAPRASRRRRWRWRSA